MGRSKEVLTTGEVAKICKVAPRTVSKWFDSGKLRGYRIPGSKDRRIPMQQLLRFMRAHGMPLHGVETGVTRVLIVEQMHEVARLLSEALTSGAGYEVRVVHSPFEAGAAAVADTPSVILVDTTMPGLQGKEGLRAMRNVGELSSCRVIALTGYLRDGEDYGLLQDGYDAVIARPFDVSQVVQAIEDALESATAGNNN
ncbi:MAG TPA: response regulator [Phycisphaerae bacterium]|nr:response regulator [Phycisphaerae bacterium]